jgi:hypothetical protein
MPTVDEFKTHGMTDLTALTEAVISQLSDNFEILVLTKDTSLNAFTLETTAIPKRQVVMQETEMTLPAPIKSFTLTGTAANSSLLKVLASNDNGVTWKAHNGVDWVTVDVSNLDDVAANAMTIASFNAITEATWKPFLEGLKVRFAYYLDLNLVTDTLQLDKLAYETVPVVDKTPKLNSIKITYDDLTIEGRLKDLERINAINLAKLNFKSNALLMSEKYEMHDMVVDTCEKDEMITTSSSGVGEATQTYLTFSAPITLGDGQVTEFSLADFKKIKKVEVK